MTMWLKAYFKKTARFLLRMCCLLLGNSFEPSPNSRARGASIFSSSHKKTQGGSVKFAECGCPVSSVDKRIAALRERMHLVNTEIDYSLFRNTKKLVSLWKCSALTTVALNFKNDSLRSTRTKTVQKRLSPVRTATTDISGRTERLSVIHVILVEII